MNSTQQQGFILIPAMLFLMILSLSSATSLNTAGYQARMGQNLTENQSLLWIAKSGNRQLIQQIPELLNAHPEILTSDEIYWLPSFSWSEDASLLMKSGLRLLESSESCIGTAVEGDVCYRFELQSQVSSDEFSTTASSTEEYFLSITNIGTSDETE